MSAARGCGARSLGSPPTTLPVSPESPRPPRGRPRYYPGEGRLLSRTYSLRVVDVEVLLAVAEAEGLGSESEALRLILGLVREAREG